MFTPNEWNYIYQVFDQLNVRGEDQKAMVLTIMRKTRAVLAKLQAPPPEEATGEPPDPPVQAL